MLKHRCIPVLLLQKEGLYKTVQFAAPKYIGDPINSVRIFNEKEVDELIFLDIRASIENREPPYGLIQDIASECFMPFAYGGGINSLKQIEKILRIGAEKVILNTAVFRNSQIIAEASKQFGSQSIVVSLDVRKNWLGRYEVYSLSGTKKESFTVKEAVCQIEALSAGEIFINHIDRDGTYQGYDIPLLKSITQNTNLPVVACGGASGLQDFKQAIQQGLVSAVAAGSIFVFHGKHRAVLITYPTPEELAKILC